MTETPWSFLEELLHPVMDNFDETATHQGSPHAVPSGFVDLDDVTNGFHPGQLVTVCGRESIGKSTLALDMTRAAAIKHNRHVLFFSLEVDGTELTMRMLSAESRIRLADMRGGKMSSDDWTQLARRISQNSETPFAVDDTPRMDVHDLTDRATRWSGSVSQPSLIVVDGIQSLEPDRSADTAQVIAENARELKVLARQLNVPVVVTANLNRTTGRNGEYPQMRDTPSGIDRFSDLVVLLHRPDAYDRHDPRMGEADLILAKHRAGPTSTVTVAHQLHYSRFVDMAQERALVRTDPAGTGPARIKGGTGPRTIIRVRTVHTRPCAKPTRGRGRPV